MPISRIPAKTSNPFDSDDEGSGDRQKRGNSVHAAVVDKHGHSRGASADGVMKRSDQQKRADPSPNLFKARREPSQESGGESSGPRFRDSEFRGREALEYKSMEDLEGYSVQKSRETTSSVENCVRVVGEIREEATQTLSALHQQGEQIKRTHEMAVDIDQNLSKVSSIKKSRASVEVVVYCCCSNIRSSSDGDGSLF
jgi:synaptosomal-associated protein 25